MFLNIGNLLFNIITQRSEKNLPVQSDIWTKWGR